MRNDRNIKIVKGRVPYRLSQLEAKYGNLDFLFYRLLNEMQTIEAVADHLKISVRTISRYIETNTPRAKFERRFCWIPTQYAQLPETKPEE